MIGKRRSLKNTKKEDYSQIPTEAPNLLGYIKNNIDKIGYKEKEYFVRSGAIESSNWVRMQTSRNTLKC